MKITDPAFFDENFDASQYTVGQIGNGFIGKAVASLFSKKFQTLVYDKMNPTGVSLVDVVTRAHAIFVAVPTPMDMDTGECHTGIVESVLADISSAASEIGRDKFEFVVVIKSTVPPGFTKKMQERHDDMRIVFSPEFLTEANSIRDFETTNRVILGGTWEDCAVVFNFFRTVWAERIVESLAELSQRPDGVVVTMTEPTVAEMVKLFTNGILATKVMFCNEIHRLCQVMNLNYDEVRNFGLLDRRIGPSHTAVPGPDGQFGYGGHCFPKDMKSLVHISKTLGTGEQIFSAVDQRNTELREHRDWEQMDGRAVIKK